MSGRRPSRPTRTILPGLDDEVWGLIGTCWDDDPLRRPPTLAVLPILEDFLSNSPAGDVYELQNDLQSEDVSAGATSESNTDGGDLDDN